MLWAQEYGQVVEGKFVWNPAKKPTMLLRAYGNRLRRQFNIDQSIYEGDSAAK